MTRHENVHRSKAQLAKQARPRAVDFMSESEGTTTRLQPDAHDEESEDDDDDTSVDSEIDTPRIAQWIDDEDLEPQEQTDDTSDSGEDNSGSEAGPSRRLRSLEDDLSTLPLGALRSAQRSLTQAHALSDTESESYSSASDDDDPAPGPTKKGPDQPPKPKRSLAKRTNKHAPIEVTSKRPVSRRRVVVDDNGPKPRDPRFMHAAGRYDPVKYKQHYEFLSGLRSDELATLRGHVKRARKLLASSPSHLRAEREEEVERLEHALKRVESTVNLDNRERVEIKALQSAKQTEKEKRKQGKAGWWMKRSEKKQLLAKARLDAISSVGGRQAVKKALEKRQKKISQKEKKTRPFLQGKAIERPDGKRRRPAGSVESGRGTKRHKVV